MLMKELMKNISRAAHNTRIKKAAIANSAFCLPYGSNTYAYMSLNSANVLAPIGEYHERWYWLRIPFQAKQPSR